MGNPLEALAGWVQDIVRTIGYPGVLFLMTLEEVFPPVPSEVILPLAGFMVGRGDFSFIPTLIVATAGTLLGALIVYGIGRWLGEDRVRRLVGRYGKYILLSEDDVDRGRDWFERHGAIAVVVARFVPGVRSVISIPAGIEKMSLWKFTGYTLIGSTAWNAALIGVGWILGDQWQTVSDYLGIVQWVVLAVIAFGVAWFVKERIGGNGNRQPG